MDLIPDLARLLGIPQADLLFYIGLLVAGANITHRLIPDDATGPLAVVQKIAQWIAFYTPNRVTKGVTTNDVVKSVIGTQTVGQVEAQVREMAATPEALIPHALEAAPEPVLTPFERFKAIAESTPSEDLDDDAR